MPDIHMMTLFVVASTAILVIPGPAVLYVTARSVQQGRTAGLVSVIGIHTGVLVHIAAAVVGLSALIVTSALAFSLVKYIGAGYLVYLGIKTILTPAMGEVEFRLEKKSLMHLFRDGVVVSVFNPKVGLFFLVFMPQVIDPASGQIWIQSMIFGLVFVCLGLVIDGFYALLAGTVGNLFKGRSAVRRAQRYVTGSIFFGLGLLTAFSGDSQESGSYKPAP